MVIAMTHPERPWDPNQIAKLIVAISGIKPQCDPTPEGPGSAVLPSEIFRGRFSN